MIRFVKMSNLKKNSQTPPIFDVPKHQKGEESGWLRETTPVVVLYNATVIIL